MKCEGNFIYKGIEERKGGEFTNERGRVIKFEPFFKITLDEIVENGKVETRTFNFPIKNTDLADKFKDLDLYCNIIVAFDIVMFRNNVRLVPYDLIFEKEED